MHVVYVIDSIGTPGGAEQSLALLAAEYHRLGVRLDVAVLHDRPGHQESLRVAETEVFKVNGQSRRAWLRSATALITSRKPDLVHTTLFESDVIGRVAARRAGVPVVSSLVNGSYGADHFDDPSLSSWKLRSAWLLDASTARLAVRMHAVSNAVADTMARALRYPRSRIDVVPRGRNALQLGRRDPERRRLAREALGITSDAPMLLAIARQEHQKGLDIALHALPAIRAVFPSVRLVVAGRDGAHTADLLRIGDALELGASVQYLGTRDDIAELLCAADVFVMPSRREGLPGALLEAMALETPAVVSDIPQILEVVDDATARIVAVEDAPALAAAVIATLEHGEEASLQAGRGRERFLAEFAIDSVAERMLGFYEWALVDARAKRRHGRA